MSWAISIIQDNADVMIENVAPILAAHFRGSDLAKISIYRDAVSAFITALLPVVREKNEILMNSIKAEPQLISKLIYELMVFDKTLRDEFSYDGGDQVKGWQGLTSDLLIRGHWFERYLEVEKSFALARYEEIINAKDSGKLDFDELVIETTRPTYGAVRIVDIMEGQTKLYKGLFKFQHKVDFLVNIQLEIFDRYHHRLRDALVAYQSSTSTVGRTLHGISREEQAELRGIGALEALCRVFGSVEYIISQLRDWGDDLVRGYKLDLAHPKQQLLTSHSSSSTFGMNSNHEAGETPMQMPRLWDP